MYWSEYDFIHLSAPPRMMNNLPIILSNLDSGFLLEKKKKELKKKRQVKSKAKASSEEKSLSSRQLEDQ